MANKTKRKDIYSIDPRNIIVPEGFNSRVNFGNIDELAEQIKQAGMLNPITVQTVKQEDGTEKYNLIDGERRYRAIMKLIDAGEDIQYVNAIIVPSTLTKEELYVQQAMRNEGKNFNEYEWAILADKIRKDCGLNPKQISTLLGKNSGVVIYWLQILDMPEDLQALIRDNKIGGSDMRRILQATDRNFDEARKEIEKLQNKAKDAGTEKLSLKSLDFDSKTKVFKDSKAILKGLNVLITYAAHFGNEEHPVEIDIATMHEALKKGDMIDDIFKRAIAENQENVETA